MPVLRRKTLVAALIVIAASLPLWPSFEEAGLPMDEGALLVYPALLLQGEVPYRDFETFYGPGSSLLLSGVYAVSGPSIFAERAVGLVYRILILTAVFALADRWNTTLAVGCTAIAALLLISTGLAAFAWIGAVACALWALWTVVKIDSSKRCFFGGLLAGLALLFRPDFGLAIVASGLPFFILMPPARRWTYLGGAAAGLLPLVALTIIAGPHQIFNNLVLFPVVYCSPGRHLPMFSAPIYLIGLFFLQLAGAALTIGIGIVAIRRNRRDPAGRLLLSLGLLAVGLMHQAAQRLDFGHVVSAALPSLSILPVSIFLLHAWWRNTPARWHHAAFASAVVLASLEVIDPALGITMLNKMVDALSGQTCYAIFVEHRGRSFPTPSPQIALSINRILNKLEKVASPGDRLFVGPADLRRTNYNDTFIYHLMPQLRPSTYFLEMNPQSANRLNSRLAADVASANWLVLTHHWDSWSEPNESVKFGSDAPTRVVQEKFQLCAQYGSYDVYRRRVSLATSK
jgi:hypothetical protein